MGIFPTPTTSHPRCLCTRHYAIEDTKQSLPCPPPHIQQGRRTWRRASSPAMVLYLEHSDSVTSGSGGGPSPRRAADCDYTGEALGAGGPGLKPSRSVVESWAANPRRRGCRCPDPKWGNQGPDEELERWHRTSSSGTGARTAAISPAMREGGCVRGTATADGPSRRLLPFLLKAASHQCAHPAGEGRAECLCPSRRRPGRVRMSQREHRSHGRT